MWRLLHYYYRRDSGRKQNGVSLHHIEGHPTLSMGCHHDLVVNDVFAYTSVFTHNLWNETYTKKVPMCVCCAFN